MKKLCIILCGLLVASNLLAQVALNEQGLYQDKNGALFTGTLETSDHGQKSVLQVKDGALDGEANYYYASGKLMETGTFANGLKEGKWLRYNESGVNIGLALFAAGKKNGTWLVWNDQGKKLFEMHYANGERTGTWYNWDANGELLSSKDYSQGN